MKRTHFLPPLLLILFCIGSACHTSYRSVAVAYNDYHINSDQQKDSLLLNLVSPYREYVNKSMNDVVGIAEKSLEKKQPECTPGNFMVDAFLIMAREKYNTQVDVAFLNFGGIRLTELPAGNVTRGKIFELMPFDNLLILQKLKGNVLQQFLDLVAGRGGCPVAGMTMQIKDKKAVNVMIAGKPLDPQSVYITANSDFIANGGDNADMLRPVPQQTNGYLIRDAIFDYINKLKNQGKKITAVEENRVTNAQ